MASAKDYTNADVVRVELKDYGRSTGYCAIMTDGKSVRLRRVTSVLNLLDKPALVQWSANECAAYVGELWKPSRGYSQAEIDGILGDARYAHRRKKDEAAGYGTMAHEIIERFMKEGYWPDDAAWESIPFEVANSLALFSEWWTNAGLVEVVEAERYVWDMEFHYGGTCDLLARDKDGQLWLIDWKTGKGIYGTMILQLAAYFNALHKLGVKPVGAKIVQIGKTDAAPQIYEPTLDELREAWRAFGSLSRMHDFITANDKRLAELTKKHKQQTAERLAQEQSDRLATAAALAAGGGA